MCEFVFLSEKVKDEMKKIYPEHIPKKYFDAFVTMTEHHILNSKNGHKIIKRPVVGLEGQHNFIFGTLMDAIETRKKFIDVFSY